MLLDCIEHERREIGTLQRSRPLGQCVGPVLQHAHIRVAAMAEAGQNRVMAVEECRDIPGPGGIAFDELQTKPRLQRIWPAHQGRHLMPTGNRLVDQVMAGAAATAVDVESHGDLTMTRAGRFPL
jgi:hypothetical protein